MNFDEKVIGAEFLRLNKKNKLTKIKKICTKEVSTDFCALPNSKGSGYKWPTLAELHKKLFNNEMKEAHNAISDVQACAKCFFKLKDNGLIRMLT